MGWVEWNREVINRFCLVTDEEGEVAGDEVGVLVDGGVLLGSMKRALFEARAVFIRYKPYFSDLDGVD